MRKDRDSGVDIVEALEGADGEEGPRLEVLELLDCRTPPHYSYISVRAHDNPSRSGRRLY